MPSEKRSTSRVPRVFPSAFKNLTDENESWYFAAIQDVSLTGARLRMRNQYIPLFTKKVTLSLFPDNHLDIEVKVIRAWVAPVSHTDKYEVGVQFVDLSEKAKTILQKFCSRILYP